MHIEIEQIFSNEYSLPVVARQKKDENVIARERSDRSNLRGGIASPFVRLMARNDNGGFSGVSEILGVFISG